MYTVGLLKQNLYEEVPNYYHWTVIQLLKLTTSDKLKQFVLIAQVYGGLIFQNNDVFILMITEVRGGLVSKLLNLHGQFLGTTFYSLTPAQFYSIVSHKIHRSGYGLGIIAGDVMEIILPLNVYFNMYRMDNLSCAGEVLNNGFQFIDAAKITFSARTSRHASK